MKKILALLLFACSGVFAQTGTPPNVCNVPIPPGEQVIYWDFATGSAGAVTPTNPTGKVTYRCAPGLTATSTLPTIKFTAGKGAMASWYCKVGPRWYPNWAAATNDFLAANNVVGEATAAALTASPLDAFNAAAAKYVKTPLSDPSLTAVWCPHQQAMFDNTPAADVAPAAPPVFVVAKLGTATTRPSYAVVNGVRAKTSKTTAVVGAACNPVVTFTETSTYMQTSPGFVAICTKYAVVGEPTPSAAFVVARTAAGNEQITRYAADGSGAMAPEAVSIGTACSCTTAQLKAGKMTVCSVTTASKSTRFAVCDSAAAVLK